MNSTAQFNCCGSEGCDKPLSCALQSEWPNIDPIPPASISELLKEYTRVCPAPTPHTDITGCSCYACKDGQYVDKTSNTGCTNCTQEMDKCCPAGKYGTPTQCKECAAGRYSSLAGTALCPRCPANTDQYQDETGQTTCKHCPGYFLDPDDPVFLLSPGFNGEGAQSSFVNQPERTKCCPGMCIDRQSSIVRCQDWRSVCKLDDPSCQKFGQCSEQFQKGITKEDTLFTKKGTDCNLVAAYTAPVTFVPFKCGDESQACGTNSCVDCTMCPTKDLELPNVWFDRHSTLTRDFTPVFD